MNTFQLNQLNRQERMKLSSNQQWYVSTTANVARVGFQWGFVPLVIYLGFRKGPEPMPSGEVVPFSLLSLLWG